MTDNNPKPKPKLPVAVRLLSGDIGSKADIGTDLRNAHLREGARDDLAPSYGRSPGAGKIILGLVAVVVFLAALLVFILVKVTS